MDAPMKHVGVFCPIVLVILLALLVKTEDASLYFFIPEEVLSATSVSCLVAANTPYLGPQTLSVFADLGQIFHEDSAVTLGSVDASDFVWPGGETLNYKNNQNKPEKAIILFHKIKQDRKCLLKPRNHREFPKIVVYTGPITTTSVLDFVNHHCSTFRTSNGQLSSEWMHKQHILDNLYKMSTVSKFTMGHLYSGLGNRLNNSYVWPTVSSEVCDSNSDLSGICAKSHKLTSSASFATSETDDDKKSDAAIGENKQQTFEEIPQCERLKQPVDKETFFQKYLKASRPFIVEGATDGWLAPSKWTNDFLREQFGEQEVHIKLTPSGDFEGVEKADLWEGFDTFKIPEAVLKNLKYSDLVVVRPAGVSMKFSKFLDLVEEAAEHGTSKNVSAYLEYSSIPEYMPSLEADIAEPEFVKGLLPRRHLNIWLSDGNTLGRLHFDPFDNLLYQLSGRKQVLLFDHHDNTALYESHIAQATLSVDWSTRKFRRKTLEDSTSMVMSPIDVLNPDFPRFPKFAGVHPLNCTLSEGDMLYMPAFWWHEVQSFPSLTEKRNLAVNFWYEPFLTREFPCPECPLDVNPYYHYLL